MTETVALDPAQTLKFAELVGRMFDLPVYAMSANGEPDLHIQIGGKGFNALVSITTWNGRFSAHGGRPIERREVLAFIREWRAQKAAGNDHPYPDYVLSRIRRAA